MLKSSSFHLYVVVGIRLTRTIKIGGRGDWEDAKTSVGFFVCFYAHPRICLLIFKEKGEGEREKAKHR